MDVVLEIAKAAGFVISADELKKSQVEISEEELEGVAGGDKLAWSNTGDPQLCACDL